MKNLGGKNYRQMKVSKWRFLVLIIITIFFVVIKSHAADWIDFGETVCASISAPAEVDSYEFHAVANDKVLVRMSECPGNMWPTIQLYDPDGNLLCEADGPTTAEIESCPIPANGFYTITAYDWYGTGTGDYCLHLQRLNNPGNDTAIGFEQTLPGRIDTCAEKDAYTFNAVADAVVRVRMTETSGNMWPTIKVYNPEGDETCDADGPSTAEIKECLLTTEGTYTILAYDWYGTGTGDYNLFLGCLNPPCDFWDSAYKKLFDDHSDLALLRQYRDDFLTRTYHGKLYTELLYDSSEDALKVLLDNPELILKARELIEANKDAVSMVLCGYEGVIYDADEIISFLDAYANESPPALKALANLVKRKMLRKRRQGKLFLGFRLK